MFNNINDNNASLFFNSQLDRQNNVVNLASVKANMNKALFNKNSGVYLDTSEISTNAIKMFQRDCDINKFNKIAMSNPEDLSYLDKMNELFSEGVIDAFEDDVISELLSNSKLWEDLGLE